MLRMAETKQLFQIADVRAYAASNPADKDVAAFAKLSGVRTVIGVPMLKNGEMVGAIATYRQEVRTFSDREIELIKDFAAQAVIAIENARLLNELRQRTDNLSHRTTDLMEALEQQTATSEVLQVISNFSGDLEPVFATILEKAVRICDATFGNIYRFDGEFFHLVATHNTPPAYAEKRRQCPYRPHPNSDIGRMVVGKTVAHIADVMAEEVYTAQLDPVAVDAVNIGRIRTILGVPLMIKGEMFGTFFLSRQEVRPFTDKQIKLVQSFAAQSVIAIENARLLNELRQSLKQQTATADVLKIISRSTFDLQSVLDTLVASVAQLCEADMVVIASPTQDRDGWRQAATYNLSPKFRELMAQKKVPSGRGSIAGRVVLEEKSVQIVDIEADPEYELKEACRIDGVNTILGVPLLREGGPIGIMVLQRRAKQPFTDKQIELAETFADQALIAIENARLFNDLRQRTTDLTEALEQQTATSNVLQVISSSPGNLEPVFETMLENAVRLCDAKFGTINRWDGEALHLVATCNVPTAFAEFRKRTPFRPGPENPISQMLMTKTVIHFHNLATEQGYIDRNPTFVAAVELGGVRTFLAVPIMKENELIGVVIVYRQEVRPFSDKQIELIKSFADQAVIAIENARLLKELRERTEDVQKLNQQLEARVADQVGEIERMSRLRRFLPPQVADLIVASGTEKQLESHRREITALFCDLRGFTGFSESADPEDVMTLLREYHEALGASINKYSGTLERYAGDGVMVVFNDPVPVENPALQAVLMALEMRDAIGALTETWRRSGHEIGFGIGISHGFATLGTIGFEGRFDYAAIGTVSNVASRLCDEAKPGQILISPRVLVAIENAVTVEPVAEFALKGIRRPLAAYNVIGRSSAS
jgi:GAF domain-containing protein